MASSLREYQNTGTNNSENVAGINWEGQTFTTTVAYKITSIKLDTYIQNSPTDPFKFSIRATSGGMPTGADLCSGTVSYSGWSGASSWKEFTFDTGVNLDASTKYAIIWSNANSATPNNARVLHCYETNPYAGGESVTSGNSGSSWASLYPGSDFMFETWGEDIGGKKRQDHGLLLGVS